jgi:hypothetical protein
MSERIVAQAEAKRTSDKINGKRIIYPPCRPIIQDSAEILQRQNEAISNLKEA